MSLTSVCMCSVAQSDDDLHVVILFNHMIMIDLDSTEWWAAEITILLAGRLSSDPSKNEETLSAMGICSTIEMLCGMILVSIFFAISTRVSNELGAGSAIGAKRAALCGMMLSITVGCTLASMLLIFRNMISHTFAREEAIVALVKSLIWPISLYHFCAAFCSSFEGIVLGSGRQIHGAVFVFISYFVIGLPVSWLCGFKFGLGVIGLYMGRVTGKAIQLCLYGILCLRTDWQHQVERASKLMEMVTAGNTSSFGDKRNFSSEDDEDDDLLRVVMTDDGELYNERDVINSFNVSKDTALETV